MYTIRQGSRVSINAPAKLNLFLELLQRRSDGYHALETLMVPVSLYDSLSMTKRTDDELNLSCDWSPGSDPAVRSPLPPAEQNIVYKVLSLLRDASNRSDLGADVQLTKRIPAQAGLGGGSSDAAAALLMANEAWELGWTRNELANVAAQVGSDVPFFLYNSLARCTGRGEVIEPLRWRGALSFAIVKPAHGLSTPKVFQHTDLPATPRSSNPIVQALNEMNFRSIAGGLFNRLQSAATKLTSWVDEIGNVMDSMYVPAHQMSGSGTSYFAVCRNKRHARHVAAKLRATRLGQVFVATSTGPSMAS